MQCQIKHLLAGAMAITGAGLIGCASHADGPYYGSEPVQSGYAEYPPDYVVGDDAYYGRGAYSGDYWVWHDHEGHEHREARGAHEQRMHADEQRRGGQFNRAGHGAENPAYGHRGAEGQSAGHPQAGRGGISGHSGAEGHGESHDGRGGEEGPHR